MGKLGNMTKGAARFFGRSYHHLTEGSLVLNLAWAMFVGGLTALFLWLYMNAEDTVTHRLLKLERVTIDLSEAAALPAPSLPVIGTSEEGPEIPQAVSDPSEDTPMPQAVLGDEPIGPDITAAPTTPVEKEAAILEEGKATPSKPIIGLPPAPDERLQEKTNYGFVPKMDENGRVPWKSYARPFVKESGKKYAALMMTGLGLSSSLTEQAINQLPPEISLSFSPFAPRLKQWMAEARAKGHEVFLDWPMEPLDYPENDPGPKTMLSSLSVDQNKDRLMWIMAQGVGYVGLVPMMGEKFVRDEGLRPLLGEIQKRGLAVVDNGLALQTRLPGYAREMGIPFAQNHHYLDQNATPIFIQARLKEVEKQLVSDDSLLALALTYPITLDIVSDWAKTVVEKGIVLAPASAVVE